MCLMLDSVISRHYSFSYKEVHMEYMTETGSGIVLLSTIQLISCHSSFHNIPYPCH